MSIEIPMFKHILDYSDIHVEDGQNNVNMWEILYIYFTILIRSWLIIYLQYRFHSSRNKVIECLDSHLWIVVLSFSRTSFNRLHIYIEGRNF